MGGHQRSILTPANPCIPHPPSNVKGGGGFVTLRKKDPLPPAKKNVGPADRSAGAGQGVTASAPSPLGFALYVDGVGLVASAVAGALRDDFFLLIPAAVP